VDHLRGAIWEVRTSLTGRIARTLFTVESGVMVLLHGFIKKPRQRRCRQSTWPRNDSRNGNMAKSNPHTGSRFDDFLKEEGIYDEVQARALKRALAAQIGEGMQAASLTKTAMAAMMSTSRSQLDRVLDPDNLSIQLDTLIKAARAVGKVVEIKISKTTRMVSTR
jgi:hypothetical protein